jgi:nucleotide-binding universal stress UspA family protein
MRILIFANGILNNNTALNLTCEVVRRTGEVPTLLKVIPPNIERHPPSTEIALTDACQKMDLEKIDVRFRIGYLPNEIIQEAKEGGYDLLVIADHKSNTLTRFLKKPLSEKILGDIPCSLLAIKGEVTNEIRRILVCDSGVGKPSLLEQFASRMENLLENIENLTILHVMSQISAGPGVRGGQLRAEAEYLIQEKTLEGEFLARDIETLERFGLKLTPKVRHGLVVDEILEEVENGDYDLVVIGAHPRYGWQGYLLDDLAQEILTQITRPLLVIR